MSLLSQLFKHPRQFCEDLALMSSRGKLLIGFSSLSLPVIAEMVLTAERLVADVAAVRSLVSVRALVD